MFQRNLLVAFCVIDAETIETIMRIFFDHASHWLSWKNVSVRVHAEVAMYSVENITTCPLLPPAMDVQTISLDRITRLQHFFALRNREAQCIVATHLQPKFWKSINNNDWATERRTGKLKGQSAAKLVKISNT